MMGFLRRILGGGDRERDGAGDGSTRAVPNPVVPDADADIAATDDDERAHQLELARFEQERTDALIRRQQQYADRSWTPPAQGGTRRAEDKDTDRG